jgi:acyl dehydratase
MEYSIGQEIAIKRTFTQSDFQRFADLSGDDNPIHIDPEFSAQTKFGRTVAHGMFLYSCVSGVLGSHLPGPGSWQTYQEMMFTSPTYAEEVIIFEVKIAAIDPATGSLRLTTQTVNPTGKNGLQGEAWVRPPGKPSPELRPEVQTEGPETAETVSSFKGFSVGQQAELRRGFTPDDLLEYADLARDPNPWFIDAQFAQKNGLKNQVVPGGLIGGLFSTLLGTRLPGPGTNYLKQDLHFLAPAYPGEEMTARVTIIRLRPEKQLVNFDTTCTNSVGEVVCQGDALVLISDVQ